MLNPYLAVAQEGHHSLWRYLVSGVFILFCWLIFGGILVALPDLLFNLLFAEQAPRTVYLAGFMLSFLPMLGALLFAVRFIHRRPVGTIWNAVGRIRWKRIAQGMGGWFLLCGLASGLEAVLFRGRYVWTLEPEWWSYLPVALLTVPVQTVAEEALFRGYLLQGLGQIVRRPIGLSVLNGLIFASFHLLNPEMSVNPWLAVANWWFLGAALTWLTLHDRGLELAIGIHTANNLFSFALVGYPGHEAYTVSLFTVREADLAYSLISLVVMMAVLGGWARRYRTEGLAPHRHRV